MLDFLATTHNIKMSLRSLKSKLKSYSLSRQTHFSPLTTIRAAIQEELKGPGQHYGYRSMWQTLRQKYSLTVRRADVMALMRELEPSGIQLRARRRFVRRVYSSRGPNHVWHVDGYDKLKPYGLAISGCTPAKYCGWCVEQATMILESLLKTICIVSQNVVSYQCSFAQTVVQKMAQWWQSSVP